MDLKTSNPAFAGKTYEATATRMGYGSTYGSSMTISGTVNKAGILMLCVLATAMWTWSQFFAAGNPAAVGGYTMVGAFGGFIAAMVTIFKKEWSPVTAPAYALLEGLALGAISSVLELRFPGIAIQSVSLTFGTLLVLLLAYRSGLIPVTQKFRMGIVAATGGIMLFYLLQFGLGFFGVHFTSINGSGPIGIGFSLIVVGIAALNLVLDFDFIENGVRMGAPKYMEWYGAFGIMVTLVWLYLEILRLVTKIRGRD